MMLQLHQIKKPVCSGHNYSAIHVYRDAPVSMLRCHVSSIFVFGNNAFFLSLSFNYVHVFYSACFLMYLCPLIFIIPFFFVMSYLVP